LKFELEKVFAEGRVQKRRLGDEEIQSRVRVDDVIMTKGNHGAYVHFGAEGDELEKRQVYVWLARNKGAIRTALSQRWKERSRMPRLYFVESKYEEWANMFAHASKYPEKNLPNPHLRIEQQIMEKFGTKHGTMKSWGVGDPNSPFPRRGYPDVHPWKY